MKKILTDAVAVGNATARSLLWYERDPREFIREGSYWKRGYPGNNYQFLKDEGAGGCNFDARTMFYYFATVNTPAMAMKLLGKEGNWIQTVPGKGWFCLLRLYSPTEAWYEGKWLPSEIAPLE